MSRKRIHQCCDIYTCHAQHTLNHCASMHSMLNYNWISSFPHLPIQMLYGFVWIRFNLILRQFYWYVALCILNQRFQFVFFLLSIRNRIYDRFRCESTWKPSFDVNIKKKTVEPLKINWIHVSFFKSDRFFLHAKSFGRFAFPWRALCEKSNM